MDTVTATAIAPEPQCQHLSRTDVSGKAGRQVCDGCKQIFQGGFPVTIIPPVAAPDEPTNKKTKKTAKAKSALAITITDDDKLSSSAALDLAEENRQVEGIAKMSTAELHTEIIQTYKLTGENFITYRLLVLDARRRMHDGEAVGECTTWKEYEDRYLKKDGESLPTCMRRVARLLEGINPDTKHRNKRLKKSNRKILEEDLDQKDHQVKAAEKKGYDRGFTDGEVAGEKKVEKLAAKKVEKVEERAAKKLVADTKKAVAESKKSVKEAEEIREKLFRLLDEIEKAGGVDGWKSVIELAKQYREELTGKSEQPDIVETTGFGYNRNASNDAIQEVL